MKLHYNLAGIATSKLHSDPDLPRVERTVALAKSVEEIWQHLIDGDLASLWMGGRMTIDPRLGGKITLAAEGMPELFGTVEGLVPGHTVAWTWRYRDGEPTQVTLEIEATEEGCRLSVTEQMVPYEIVVVPPVFG